MIARNRFGGPWTQKKIEILQKYLKFYTTALSGKFNLFYADAFAGTGKQSSKIEESQIELIPQEDFQGSVMAALETNPPFSRYFFNDLDKEFTEALREITDQHLEKDITISQRDANIFVPMFCRMLGKYDRAVLFVDPFSTELNWKTLTYVAESKKIDMWLLFPLSVIIRMTKKDGEIIPEWRKTLDRLLGTNDWEQALYSRVDVPQTEDMFGFEHNKGMERINPDAVQDWVKQRLEEQFAFVTDPVPLKNNNRPLFSLFLAVSNDSPKATQLARKVSKQITSDYK